MKRSLLITCIFLLPVLMLAQTTDHQTQQVNVPIQNAATAELNYGDISQSKRITEALLQVRMDWGPEYTLGSSQDNPINAKLLFKLQASSNGNEVEVFSDTVYTLQLTNSRPEVVWSLNMLSFTETENG